jgi:hypothetical protein
LCRDVGDPRGVGRTVRKRPVRQVGPGGAVRIGLIGREEVVGVACRVQPFQTAIRADEGLDGRSRPWLPARDRVTDRLPVRVRPHPPIIQWCMLFLSCRHLDAMPVSRGGATPAVKGIRKHVPTAIELVVAFHA